MTDYNRVVDEHMEFIHGVFEFIARNIYDDEARHEVTSLANAVVGVRHELAEETVSWDEVRETLKNIMARAHVAVGDDFLAHLEQDVDCIMVLIDEAENGPFV